LDFSGPFENGKPLLDKPVENEWVCVKDTFSVARDYSPKTKDMFKFCVAFRGKTTATGTYKQRLENPYKIALIILVQDKQGKEYTVATEVIDFNPEIIVRDFNAWSTAFGESSYGGAYMLPIKLNEISTIRMRLSKIDS
jgi:hypothetical protein